MIKLECRDDQLIPQVKGLAQGERCCRLASTLDAEEQAESTVLSLLLVDVN